jgi:hypothetical protein
MTRAERLVLLTAALRGTLSGAVSATVLWLLDHLLR